MKRTKYGDIRFLDSHYPCEVDEKDDSILLLRKSHCDTDIEDQIRYPRENFVWECNKGRDLKKNEMIFLKNILMMMTRKMILVWIIWNYVCKKATMKNMVVRSYGRRKKKKK